MKTKGYYVAKLEAVHTDLINDQTELEDGGELDSFTAKQLYMAE